MWWSCLDDDFSAMDDDFSAVDDDFSVVNNDFSSCPALSCGGGCCRADAADPPVVSCVDDAALRVTTAFGLGFRV